MMQIKLKIPLFFVLLFAICLPGYTQVKNYRQEMLSLYKSFNKYFYIDSLGYYKETEVPEKDSRPVSYLWPLCGLLQANNEMEAVMNKGNLLMPAFKIIQKYHTDLSPAPETKNNWGYQSFKNNDALLTRYTELINNIPALIEKGLSAAVYTQTTDVEGEINGFITYDRKVIKMPVDKLRALNTRLTHAEN